MIRSLRGRLPSCNGHLLGNAVALVWLLLLSFRALSTVDISWDSICYHLPFAARLVGIFSGDGYIFEPDLELDYLGFPKLMELIQGILWKATRWITAANLVSLFCLILLIWTSCRKLRIPFWQITLFLSSVPLILIHSTTSYIDLPVGCLLGISYVCLLSAILNKDYTLRSYFWILFPLVIATNSKLLAVPVALFLSFVTILLFTVQFLRQPLHRRVFNKNLWIGLGLSFGLLVIASFPYIKNFIQFNNPIYPYSLHLGFINFNGQLGLYLPSQVGGLTSSIQNLFLNFKYFFISLSEVPIFKIGSPGLWTIDMYNLYNETEIRYGGYFVANIVFWISILFVTIDKRDSKHILILSILLLLWLYIGFLPGSSEERYWLVLPISLSITALLFIGLQPINKSIRIFHALVYSIQMIIFIFVVINLNGYIIPSDNFHYLTSDYGYSNPMYKLNIQTPICIVGEEPETFLYKLENPTLDIQTANSVEECIYTQLQ
jgi:hypothetical protein